VLRVARLMLLPWYTADGGHPMNERSFVQQAAERADCEEQRAETLIFSVFQELRDRLTPKEAADVAAQLPTSTAKNEPAHDIRRMTSGARIIQGDSSYGFPI
jgi:hypothetical protein